MSTPPQYSPDGKWQWDGQQWVPVPETPEQSGSVTGPGREAKRRPGRVVGIAGGVGAIATALTGVVVLFQTMGNSPNPGNPNPQAVVTSQHSPPDQAPTTISFKVVDELGPLEAYGLVSEQVAVVINGTTVGTITVDSVNKHAEMVVTEPAGGTYNYQLASQDTFVVRGRSAVCEGQGSGSIAAANGDRFDIDFMAHSCPLQLSLVRE